MKKILFILLVGLNISSCAFNPKIPNRDNYIIPDSLLSFFPIKSEKYRYLEIINMSENAQKDEIPLFLSRFYAIELLETYQCNNKESLQSLMKEYRSQSLFSVKSEDNNYFVIEDERVLFSTYDSLQLREKYSMSGNNGSPVKSCVFFFEKES